MGQSHLTFNGLKVPVDLHIEKRRGYRASFTKKGLTIRIPNYFSQKEQEKIYHDLITWAKNVIAKKPNILNKYQPKAFQDGHKLNLFDRTLTVRTQRHNQKSFKGKILGAEIQILIPQHETSNEVNASVISRILANEYYPFIHDRLNYWNSFFPIKHNKLRLKYNSSNWGSCSGKRNINLSTRLLLCPLEAIDYVIVHECAHLIHHNHSKAFWDEVERVMPGYKTPHYWLKKNGSQIDFIPIQQP